MASREFKVAFIGELRHTVAIGTDIFGNIQRLDNALRSVPGQARACAEQRKHETQMENAKIEVRSPFRRRRSWLKNEAAGRTQYPAQHG